MYLSKNIFCALLLSSTSFLQNLWAGTPYLVKSESQITDFYVHFTPVISLALGGVVANAGETQTLSLQSEIIKKYVHSTEAQVLGMVDLFLGAQRRFNARYSAELGISFVTAAPIKLSGQIWDDADEDFNNFVYQYQIQHKHLALKAKLLRHTDYFGLKPYLSAGFGIASNQAKNFTAVAIIEEAVAFPDFTPNNSRSYTYSLGVGVQKSLGKYWQLGLGYEYADWGKSQLGAAPEQTTGMGLKLSHLYNNGVFLSLTWLARGE